MPKKDNRIDAYIAKSQPFARPILRHLRALVHLACPDVQETIKWGFPHFNYKDEMLCSMASFKEHCAFGFWKASLMKDDTLRRNAGSQSSMGHIGKISSMDDLPSDKKMTAYIKEAAKLNDNGVKVKRAPAPKEKKELLVPDYFTAAIRRNKKALDVFNGFSYSNKKEYVQWVAEAKTEETRLSRLATSVEWLSEGKTRNWKYLAKK
jgi:uncharacterized protein YdeI (YjbR/CyaY-like superfamily)